MILDDHKVTDDWYVTKHWCSKVLGSKLGMRILQNALTAYAVFQGWGNTPERFAVKSGQYPTGLSLLKSAALWFTKGFNDSTTEQSIAKYVGVQCYSASMTDIPRSTEPVRWHYTIALLTSERVVAPLTLLRGGN